MPIVDSFNNEQSDIIDPFKDKQLDMIDPFKDTQSDMVDPFKSDAKPSESSIVRKLIDISTSAINPTEANLEQNRLDTIRTFYEQGRHLMIAPLLSISGQDYTDMTMPEPPGGWKDGVPIDEYGKAYLVNSFKSGTSDWDIESVNKLKEYTSEASRGIMTGIKSLANSLGREVGDISVDLYDAFDKVTNEYPTITNIFKKFIAPIPEAGLAISSGIMNMLVGIPLKAIFLAQGMDKDEAEELANLKASRTTYQPYTEGGKILTEIASKVLGFTFEVAHKSLGEPAAQMLEQSVVGEFIRYLGGKPEIAGMALDEAITFFLGAKGLGTASKAGKVVRSSIRTAIEAPRIEKYSKYVPSLNPPLTPMIPAMPPAPEVPHRYTAEEEIKSLGIEPDINLDVVKKAKARIDEIEQIQEELKNKEVENKVIVDTQVEDVIKEELKIKGKKVRKIKGKKVEPDETAEPEFVKEITKTIDETKSIEPKQLTPTEELTALQEKFNNKEIKTGDYIRERKRIQRLIDFDKAAEELKTVTDLDELTGTKVPEELNTETNPFRDKNKKHTNTMSKLFDEKIKSVNSSPEVYARYLINEVNRYLNGEEVDIGDVRNRLSELSVNADNLQRHFDQTVDFEYWKDTVNEASRWARSADRSKIESSGVHLTMGIDPTLIKPFYSKLKESIKDLKFGKMDIEQLKKTLKGKQVSDAEIDTILGGLKGTVTRQDVMNEVEVNMMRFKDVILGGPKLGDVSMEGVISAPVAQFSSYQESGSIPGSYRELFVTAPTKNFRKPTWNEFKSYYEKQGMGGSATKEADLRFMYDNEIKRDAFEKGLLDSIGVTTEAKWQDGHPNYSDIQNPIIRIRYNDRVVDGKKILFVEEMQPPTKSEMENMPPELAKRAYNIGVKRMLAKAKEEGYDGVAWTTGEMQANRYDLSKHLDSVYAIRNADGNISISGFKDNKRVVDKVGIVDTELESYVGKELSSKIINDLPIGKLRSKTYENLDLKVGGKGLKYVYDKQLPSLFKKYGKEGVEELEIPTGDFLGRKPSVVGVDDPRYIEAMTKPISVPFIPITSKTPSHFTLYSGLPTDKITSAFIKLGQNFAKGMKESEDLKRFNPITAAKLFRKKYTASFVERSGNTARILSEAPGNIGYDLKASMYLSRGGHPKALRVFDQMRKEVDSGLDANGKYIKDGVIKALRILDIAKYKTRKQFSFPKNSSPEESAIYIESFMYKKINGVKDLTPKEAYEIYHINEDGSVGGRVGAYFDWMRKAVKDAYEEGLISEQELKDLTSHNYRKIKLVELFDKKEEIKLGSKKLSVYDSGIERLARGKEIDIYDLDSNLVALETFNTLYSRIYKNRANRDLHDLALEDENNPFARIKKDRGTKIPEDFRHYTAKVFIDGKPKTIFLADSIGPEWITSNAQTTYKYGQFIRFISGTPLVKTFATGINQTFAFRNLPRDAMQLWFTSRIRRDVPSKVFGKYQSVFSPTLPIATYQLLRQYKNVVKDAALRVGRFDDYIDNGGGMELLTPQGRIFFHGKRLESAAESFYKFGSYLGTTSELMSRMAIAEKVIERRALDRGMTIEDARKDKAIGKEATFAARDYMDFSQGGDIVKAMDNGIPYINAKLVAMRGFVRAFKDQPLVAAYKLTQFAMLVGGVYIGNQMLHPKTMKDLDGDRRTQGNLVFPLGDSFGFKDSMNETRYPFIMIPINQDMKFFKTLFEGGLDLMTGKKVDVDRIVQSLKDFAPADVTTLPPTVSGALGYAMNKDFWLGKEIVPKSEGPFDYQLPKALVGGEGGSENEWTGKTPQAAIDLGKATGLSPDRLRYLIGQLITNDNMYAQILGKAYQEAFGQLPERDREFILAEALSKVPVIKAFFDITNPYNKFASSLKQAEDKATLDRFIENRGLDIRAEAYIYDKTVTRSQIENYISSFKDIDVQDRLRDRLQFQEDIKGLTNHVFWLKLKSISSVKARAEEYVKRVNSLDEEERHQLAREENIVDMAGGVLSKEFWTAVAEVKGGK